MPQSFQYLASTCRKQSVCRFLTIEVYHDQYDQIGQFIQLWATFQSLWQQIFAQILIILGNFCKGVKIFHFSC